MILIVAEKPSVAHEIANCIGANDIVKYDSISYYQGNGYIVSNALGHLYDLGQPEDYGYIGKWKLEDLPLTPEFKFFPKHSPNPEKEQRMEIQRKLLTELLSRNDVEYIISATDAGREGELIFRRIYQYNHCHKPVKRLWISSLTEESILNGMGNLLDHSAKDNEYLAGHTRSQADWLFGMSMSRLYSIVFNTTHKVGRVKTATLNLIVQREESIKNFKRQPFYKVLLENSARWCNGETDTFQTREKAQSVVDRCNNRQVVVKSADRKQKSTDRPLLFNLTTLQQEANAKYDYTASKTLEYLQTLYESKLTTYPRTDSSYLSSDMHQTIENTLNTLENISIYSALVSGVKKSGLNIDGRVINDKKISDHHAVIPTLKCTDDAIKSLSKECRNILDLVVKRFIAVLSQPYEYHETNYTFEVEGECFKLTTKEPITLGWKAIYQETEDTPDDESVNNSISYQVGDTFIAENLTLMECETKAPQHYNDRTLLSAMENIDRKMETTNLKQYVKGSGLGTSATRAGIIEDLEKNGYTVRQGKNIVATEMAITFINQLPSMVKNIEMTAQWEQQFTDIANGKGNPQALLDDVQTLVNQTLTLEKSREHPNMGNRDKVSLGECPRCKAKSMHSNVFEGKKSYYCERGLERCGFSIWKEDRFLGNITQKVATDLLSKGSAKINGKLYTLEDTGQYVNVRLVRIGLGACPRCRQQGKSSQVFEGEKNYYCETGREGCRFSIWKQDRFLGNISAKNVQEVLSTGKTNIGGKPHHLVDSGQYINLKRC